MVPNNANAQFTGAARAYAEYDVTMVPTNSPVSPGNTLEVDWSATNKGTARRERELVLTVEGQQRDSVVVNEPGGGSASGTLTWDTTTDGKGDYQ